MNILDFLQTISAGSVLSVIVIILSLVEITPIKVSPLRWIGKRINADALERLDNVEKKLDEHIAQSYRNKILAFQNECLLGVKHTREEFDELIDACEAYTKYTEENNLRNDKVNLAIDYVKRVYIKCQDERTFADV